jgi:competence protein ComEA
MFRIITIVVLALVCSTGLLQAGQKETKKGDATASQTKAAAPVNLNTAGAAELQSLPGIGAATAQRIIEYREKHGGFKKIEELMNVKGIGEKSFLKIKDRLTVAAPKA